jgi:hypothetical protein
MVKQEKIKKEKETKIDQQIKKYIPFLALIGVLVLLFIVLSFVFQSLGKVKYEGLVFTKEKYGDVLIYHYSYLTKVSNGNVRAINVLLRTNPAENNVPIDGEIIYPENKAVYMSINSTGLNCTYSMVAISELTNFIANNDLSIKIGNPDKSYAEKNNQTYVTCEKYPSNMVISIKTGEETIIRKTGDFCYNVEVADCEILPALEKFIVQSIIDAKNSED